jgi:diguanylate cyclase (GGDEF)-like protein
MDFHAVSPAAARETMCRTAAFLFLVGAVMTVLGIAFPHSPKADIPGFWAIAVVNGLVAALLLGLWERLPEWSYQGFMVLGSVMVSLALLFNGERHGGPAVDNEVLYLWIALYSGYFFTRRETIAQLTVVAAAYAAALLAINPGQVGFTRWFITVGMVSVAGALVHVMKQRNDQLVARLFDAVRTDLLTGLTNRQGFDERLELELERSRRTSQSLALVLADIDGFKELNDRFGHPAGDAALTAVGRVAGAVVRKTDTMARIGGDEFAAILPSAETDGAFELAERLRREIARLRNEDGESLTMSFGVVEFPLHGDSPKALVEAADRALYRAKGLGRNRSVVHRAEAPDSMLRSPAMR